MALNDLIAQGAQFAQAPDPFRQYAVMQQLEQGQQTNALNRMKMQEAQRGMQEQNQLRALYQGGMDMSSPEAVRRVAAISPAAAQALGTWQTKQAGDRVTAQKTGADAVGTALKNSRMMLDGISTPEQYMQWHLGNHSDPVLGDWLKQRGVTAEKALQQIQQAMQTPGGFEQLLLQSKIGSEKALENHFAQYDTGAQIGQTVTPKYGGGPTTVVPGSVQTKQMTPGQAEANRIAQGHLKIAQEGLKLRQNEATRKAEGMVDLPPKEIQKREAAYPQATTALTNFESNASKFVKDLQALIDHPGLPSITGIAAGRLPGITDEGRAAQALYDKIVAKGGFQMLQDIRAASKTGGGLGAVSNQEGTQLKAAFAAIDRRQEAADVKKALQSALEDLEGSKTRMREAYDMTYEYKANKPAGAATMTPQDREALDWANKNPTDPRAAAIKKLHGG